MKAMPAAFFSSRRDAKMYQQVEPQRIQTMPPPLPSVDEQERNEIMREAEIIDRANDKCRSEIDDVLKKFCGGEKH